MGIRDLDPDNDYAYDRTNQSVPWWARRHTTGANGPMNINQSFPSKYLKASDLNDSQHVVIIDRVTEEEVGQAQDRKPILYFKGKSKGLVLNKTNARKIIAITQSDETSDWEGREIAIFPSTTEFAGEQVSCIRVKAAPKKSAGSAPAAPVVDADEDEPPF